ncbi:hypothetical protein GCM10011581_26720 [Saccharopolyspora subtropica]|uniref:HTH gntR-type domain-containing protein n=1 Tax=Saccharopolyspora thermophila TaxID=89367 RepID=A0A917JX44_9PSEU|nr:GntR family transcriptional regulator [Saccharopolyspora subtropica]GGI88254.1 hypothetical protein GCM10011581_26720 [Saccharopolyspora subtropica]
MSLPDELAEQLLAAIIDGTYPPGAALPSEGELAEQFSVSRLTVREAVKALRVQKWCASSAAAAPTSTPPRTGAHWTR